MLDYCVLHALYMESEGRHVLKIVCLKEKETVLP